MKSRLLALLCCSAFGMAALLSETAARAQMTINNKKCSSAKACASSSDACWYFCSNSDSGKQCGAQTKPLYGWACSDDEGSACANNPQGNSTPCFTVSYCFCGIPGNIYASCVSSTVGAFTSFTTTCP